MTFLFFFFLFYVFRLLLTVSVCFREATTCTYCGWNYSILTLSVSKKKYIMVLALPKVAITHLSSIRLFDFLRIIYGWVCDNILISTCHVRFCFFRESSHKLQKIQEGNIS